MNAKNVWILDEGSQGHVVQSRGLVRELGKVVPLQVTELRIRCAVPRRMSRSWVKRLLRLHRKQWLFRCLHPKMELPNSRPDLIVASGPHSLVALEFLSKTYACPSVFVQGTIKVPLGAVTCVMRPFEGEYRDDFIQIPLLFNEITPGLIHEAKQRYLLTGGRSKTRPLKALFIGESSGKIRFDPSDWDHLIRFVNRSWKHDGIQWLISTSYRTNPKLEQQLRENIVKDAVYDAVWYSSAPRAITKEFLGLADSVYVTMDSLTMMTEAVSSGLQVHVVCPAAHVFDLTNSHHRYINDLQQANLVTIIHPGEIEAAQPATSGPAVIDYAEAIQRMLHKIGWNP